MSRLWTPPGVDRDVRAGTLEHNANLMSMLRFNTPVCAEWNPELALIDPRLRLAKATTDADHPLIRAGFYHFVMVVDDEPLFCNPLTGMDGEFVEPTSQMLEVLRQNDLQSARATVLRERAKTRAELAAERDKERATEDRQDELRERVDAASRTQVSLNRDTAWGQNAKGAGQSRGNKR